MSEVRRDPLDELKSIDTSAVEQLTRIRAELDGLTERLERLDQEKSRVSVAVFDKIRSDYKGKKAGLEQEAGPLTTQVRDQFNKLEALLESVETAAAKSALDKEELELRLKLGEFDEEEFGRRTKGLDKALQTQHDGLTQISKVKEVFVMALGSGGELASAPPRSPLEPRTSAVEQPPAKPQTKPAEASEAAESPTPLTSPTTSATESAEADTTVESQTPAAAPATEKTTVEPKKLREAATEAPKTPVKKPRRPTEALPAPGKTTMLPIARLIALDKTDAPEILLGPLTSMGRTAENDVVISENAVSRRHAEVELGTEGFLLKDLGSGNGTYVNGEAIDERLLVDGDRIQVGTSRFEFKA